MNRPNPLYTHALVYANQFHAPVFPLKPRGKTPLTVRGFKDASREESIIRGWWEQWPEANVGLVTGEEAGLLVLDIDNRHGGDDSLADLERRYGPLPHTPMVLTGGGGAHYYFRYPLGARIGNRAGIASGIDIRAQGGYVVAPPSVHPSCKTYEWEMSCQPSEIPFADVPIWLLELIKEPMEQGSAAKPPEFWRDLVANGAKEGRRNELTSRLAGHLLRRYVDPMVALDFIRAWNQLRNRPPLPEEEVIQIVNSVAGTELRRRQKGGRV